MQNVIVDTSVILAVLLDEPSKDFIVESTQNTNLLAPTPLHWEIGNALSAMFKRKRITLDQAREALDVYDQIPIRFVDVELEQAVVLSEQLRIYAYDAYFLVCAQTQYYPLLTLDAGLKSAARQIGVNLIEVTP